jgi:hypothetical protein
MKPGLQPDGLHPNERGVAVLVDQIAPVVADSSGAVVSAQFAAAAAAGIRRTSRHNASPASTVDGATLGILYTTEPAAPALPSWSALQRAHRYSLLGSAVGLGVCSATTGSSTNPRQW